MKIKELNFKKMSCKAIKEIFGLHYIGNDYIKHIVNRENLSNVQIKNTLIKENKRISNIMNSKKVKFIECVIQWKKSSIWGNNPHLGAIIYYKDGTHETKNYTCTGCGYDKASTVISNMFNDVMKYKLYELSKYKQSKAPYGIYIGKYDKYFGGGVGINCYNDIVKFIGGKMKTLMMAGQTDIYKFDFE